MERASNMYIPIITNYSNFGRSHVLKGLVFYSNLLIKDDDFPAGKTIKYLLLG